MIGNNMKTQINKTESGGYAILFAVLLVSIILAITLGILNVALKEFNFTSTARNSHVSFFAADTGGECALYAKIKKNMMDTLPLTMDCGSQTVQAQSLDLGNNITRFTFDPIDVQDGCAQVDIVVDNSSTQVSKTTINAHGYNVTCAIWKNNPTNTVERLLSYEFTDIASGTTGGIGGGN